MSEFGTGVEFRLGDWVVRPSLNRLEAVGSGDARQLEPKVMETLCALAARPGDVFGRDELMASIWPDVIVGEEVLTRCVSELRRALGDDTRRPRYVETIRKGGYRLLENPVSLGDGLTVPKISVRWGLIWSIAALVLILAIAGTTMLLQRRGRELIVQGERQAYSVLPLTTYQGNEMTPALSPDGERVAFCWEGSKVDGDLDIYIRRIDSELPLRITDHPDFEFSPIWSPDGGSLAFLRADSSGTSLLTVPALGGATRRRMHAEAGIGSLQWLEGDRILLSAKLERSQPFAHYMLHLATSKLDTLGPALSDGDDWRVTCAPDGERLAFIHQDSAGNPDIYLRQVDGSGVERLTSDNFFPSTLVWSRDGRSLIVAGARRFPSQLWRLDIGSGEYEALPFRGDNLFKPTLARDVDRLVYQDQRRNLDVWRLDLAVDDVEAEEERLFISSTRHDMQPDIGPDGRVAFSSTRSGNSEIWVSEADGSRPYQVTDSQGPLVFVPRWSPDGDRIAFELSRDGRTELGVVEASGGQGRIVSPQAGDYALCGWLPDGRSLVAGRTNGEDWSLVAINRESSEIELLAADSHYGLVSPDGAWLTFARPREAGLWRKALPQGPEMMITETYPARGNGRGWRLCERGVLLFHHRPAQIRLMLLEPGADWRVLKTWEESISSFFACDRAGEDLLLVRSAEENTDLMLVDGFR